MVITVQVQLPLPNAENREIEAVHNNNDIIGGHYSHVQNNTVTPSTLESVSAGEKFGSNDMEASGPHPAAAGDSSENVSIGHCTHKGNGSQDSRSSCNWTWKMLLVAAFVFLFSGGLLGGGIAVGIKIKKNNDSAKAIISNRNEVIINVTDTTSQTQVEFVATKAGKPASSHLKCGDIITGKTTLKENLVCPKGSGGDDGNVNAALTLIGPKARVYCKKGSMITQDVADGAAAGCKFLDGYTGNLEEDADKVQVIKAKCGLPYPFGIILKGGAKAIGCNIENFLVGAYFGLGAKELRDTTASKNRYGVVAETNTTAKITNL